MKLSRSHAAIAVAQLLPIAGLALGASVATAGTTPGSDWIGNTRDVSIRTINGKSFTLKSNALAMEAAAALPVQAREADLAFLGDTRTRFGDGSEAQAGENRIWARAIGGDVQISSEKGLLRPTADGSLDGVQIGTDLIESRDGAWRGGVYVGWITSKTNLGGFAGPVAWTLPGKTQLSSEYVALYTSYAHPTGTHVDAVFQYGSQRYELMPTNATPVEINGDSLTASIEVGRAFPLATIWTIEPSVQAGYHAATFADLSYTGAAALRVKGDYSTSAGRLQPYARAAVRRSTGNGDLGRYVGLDDTPAVIRFPARVTTADLAIGASLAVNQTMSVFGELGRVLDIGGDARVRSSLGGSIGVRGRW